MPANQRGADGVPPPLTRALADSGGAQVEMGRAAPASKRRTVVAIGTGLTVLGAMVLVGGIVDLALAPTMAAGRGDAPGFLLALGGLSPAMAVGLLVLQYWRTFVAIQLVF